MIRKLLSWSQGKKTYLTVIVGVGLGIAQAPPFNVHIPSYIDWALGFLGLGAARMAITAQSQATATAAFSLIQNVLSQVTTAETDGPSVTTVTQPVSLNTNPSPTKTLEEEAAETKALNTLESSGLVTPSSIK